MLGGWGEGGGGGEVTDLERWLLSLELPRVPNIQIQEKSKVSFCKIS